MFTNVYIYILLDGWEKSKKKDRRDAMVSTIYAFQILIVQVGDSSAICRSQYASPDSFAILMTSSTDVSVAFAIFS